MPDPHLWKVVASRVFLPTATHLYRSQCSWLLSPAESPVPAALPSQAPGLFFAGPKMGGLGKRIRGVGGNTGKAHSGVEPNFPWEKEALLLQRQVWLSRPPQAFASKPETLGENRPKWATSPSPGEVLSVTVAAPVPQIDASPVAPRITGGIFGAGRQPYFGRLSASSLLSCGGWEGGKQSVLSMGTLPASVPVHTFRRP